MRSGEAVGMIWTGHPENMHAPASLKLPPDKVSSISDSYQSHSVLSSVNICKGLWLPYRLKASRSVRYKNTSAACQMCGAQIPASA